MTCSRCNGVGWVAPTDQCWACKGTGVDTRPPAPNCPRCKLTIFRCHCTSEQIRAYKAKNRWRATAAERNFYYRRTA